MKIFINTIAGIAFIGQLIAFIFNCLTLHILCTASTKSGKA